LCLKVLR